MTPVRAGILVTGTEVLNGRVSDRNGPWISERLGELGVEVGTHPGRRRPSRGPRGGASASCPTEGLDLIVTSGGLGPTADDLTAEVVGRFAGREMVLDEEMEGKIAAILRAFASRWRRFDTDAILDANRKQAMIPEGSTALDPRGRRPAWSSPPASRS